MSIANVMSILGAAAVLPIVEHSIGAADAGVAVEVAYGYSMWPCLIAGFISLLSVILLSARTTMRPRTWYGAVDDMA